MTLEQKVQYNNLSEISRESALSLPAERQEHCTLLYRAERQRNPPKGAPSGGLAPQTSDRGLRPLDPLPPFRQRQVCYAEDVILPRMCTYAVQLSAI